MEVVAGTLRNIGTQVGAKTLKEVGLLPGVRAAFRLTVRYHDRRFCDSVATLRRLSAPGATLDVVYRGAFGHKPLTFTIDPERYDALVESLQKINFDHLADQPTIPAHGVDLWLLERAAGSFYKSVILAPELTSNVYARLVYIVGKTLPEAIREVRS